jgi:hypothetical protein
MGKDTMTPTASRAATRAADAIAAGEYIIGIDPSNGRDVGAKTTFRLEVDGSLTLVKMEVGDPLRSHPLWRRYVRATSRLRLCTDATPRSIQRARFAAVLELELAIMRDTHLTMRAVFDAAERESDRVLHRARRWAA